MISTPVRPSFSLFLQTGFQGRSNGPSGQRAPPVVPHPPASRKAGYICTQRYGPTDRCTALQVHQSVSYTARKYHTGSTSMHKNRSPRKQGRHHHAIESALSPQAQAKPGFPPAPTQNWAYQAGTRGFIGVPFRGFLGPPSETDDLTRILRRRLAPYSISQI